MKVFMIKKLMIYSFLLIGLNAQLNAGDEKSLLESITQFNEKRFIQLEERLALTSKGLEKKYDSSSSMQSQQHRHFLLTCLCCSWTLICKRNFQNFSLQEIISMSPCCNDPVQHEENIANSLDSYEEYIKSIEDQYEKRKIKSNNKIKDLVKRVFEYEKKASSESGRMSPASEQLQNELYQLRAENHQLYIDSIKLFESSKRRNDLEKSILAERNINERMKEILISRSAPEPSAGCGDGQCGAITIKKSKQPVMEVIDSSWPGSFLEESILSVKVRTAQDSSRNYSFNLVDPKTCSQNQELRQVLQLMGSASEASAGCGDGPGEK